MPMQVTIAKLCEMSPVRMSKMSDTATRYGGRPELVGNRLQVKFKNDELLLNFTMRVMDRFNAKIDVRGKTVFVEEVVVDAENLITATVEGYDPFSGRGRLDKAVASLMKKVKLRPGHDREIFEFFTYREPRMLRDVVSFLIEYGSNFGETLTDKYFGVDEAKKLWRAYVLDQKQMEGPSGSFGKYKKGVHF